MPLEMDDAVYRTALKRVVQAKKLMDAALAVLDQAEDEWHQATVALDELENQPYPTAEEVRGILGAGQTTRSTANG